MHKTNESSTIDASLGNAHGCQVVTDVMEVIACCATGICVDQDMQKLNTWVGRGEGERVVGE